VVTATSVVAAVADPELPMLTIADLGILRDVDERADGEVVVTITPTYSGCPAMEQIRADVLAALAAHGVPRASVRTELAPAWTTDWITERGRRILTEHGIAPPSERRGGPVMLALVPRCPNCGSGATHEVSRFGSTACKALWACDVCREPFEHVKAL
jgi:ring-1,2-phenylacetyl-CoA epoxidase subunit PaaD